MNFRVSLLESNGRKNYSTTFRRHHSIPKNTSLACHSTIHTYCTSKYSTACWTGYPASKQARYSQACSMYVESSIMLLRLPWFARSFVVLMTKAGRTAAAAAAETAVVFPSHDHARGNDACLLACLPSQTNTPK